MPDAGSLLKQLWFEAGDSQGYALDALEHIDALDHIRPIPLKPAGGVLLMGGDCSALGAAHQAGPAQGWYGHFCRDPAAAGV